MSTFDFKPLTEQEIEKQRSVYAIAPAGLINTDFQGITPAKPDYGFWDAFAASFEKEHLSGALLDMWGPEAYTKKPGDDKKVNPFEWLRQNVDEEELAKIDPWVGKGVFDDVDTVYELKQRLNQLRYEMGRNERADAHWFGSTSGAIFGAVADPISFVPFFGLAAKGGQALRLLRSAGVAARAHRATGGAYRSLWEAYRIEKMRTEAAMGMGKLMGVQTGLAGSRAGAVGYHMTLTALIETGRELGLHDEQITRTLAESMMNIGFAGLLGGGFGAFSRVRSKDSPLNPGNAQSVTEHLDSRLQHLYDDGIGYRSADESAVVPASREIEEITPEVRAKLDDFEARMKDVQEGGDEWVKLRDDLVSYLNERGLGAGSPRSAGAMAVGELGDELGEVAPGLFSRVPGVKGFLKFVRANKYTGTPIGRWAHTTSAPARRLYAGLMDTGGTMTKGEADGLANMGFSAEDYAGMMHHEFFNTALATQYRARREVNRLMATLREQGKLPEGAPGKVEDLDWNNLFHHHLHTFVDAEGRQMSMFDLDEILQKRMLDTYGREVTEAIIGHARKWADEVFQVRRSMMGQLKHRGIVKDEARIAQYEQEIADFNSRLKDLNKEAREAGSAGKSGKDAPATVVRSSADIRREIADVEAKRTDARNALNRENEKVDDLGGQYGTAQMWDNDNILAGTEAFKNFWRGVLKNNVDEDWLQDTFGFGRNLLEELGTKPIPTAGLSDEAVNGLQRLADDAGVGDVGPVVEHTLRDGSKSTSGTPEITLEQGAAIRQQVQDQWWETPGGDVLSAKQRTMFEAYEELDRLTREIHQLNRDARMTSEGEKVNLERAVDKAQVYLDRIDRQADIAANAEKQAQDAARRVAEHERNIENLELGRTVGQVDENPFDITEALDGPALPEVADAARQRRLHQKQRERFHKRVGEAAAARQEMRRLWSSYIEYQSLLAKLEAAATKLDEVGESVASAKKKLEDYRRKGNDKRAGVDEVLDRMVRDITSGDSTKLNTYMEKAEKGVTEKTPARLKHRTIRLTPEQRLDAIRQGWLRSDMEALLYTESRQLSGALGMAQALNLGDGPAFNGTFTDQVEAVAKDFQEKIEASSSPREQGQLKRERDLIMKDFNVLRDRLMGNLHHAFDPHSTLQWTSKRMREVNFIRYVPGFLAASFTDMATVHMIGNGMGGHLFGHALDAARLLTSIEDSGDWLTHLAASTEVISQFHFNGTRSAQLNNLDDAHLYSSEGIGQAGTKLHGVTDVIAKGTGKTAEVINKLSGMPMWNGTWKIMIGLHMSKQIRNMAKQGWDNLTPKQRANWLSLGVDEDLAKKVLELSEIHGNKGNNPLDSSDLGLDKWHESGMDGARAASQFKMAMNRAMTRAIITPGIGDTPPLMEHWFAKFMFQFQSYAYTFINRFMSPMSQKLRTGVDVSNMTTMAVLLLSANLTMAVKNHINGKNMFEMTPENYVYDMIDRSGFFSYLTPYFDGVLKLTAPHLDELGLNFTGTRSRYSSADWYSSLLGVNSRVFMQEIPNLFHSVAEGDAAKLGKQLLRWVPLNQWMRFVGHSLGEEGSDVVNFGFLE